MAKNAKLMIYHIRSIQAKVKYSDALASSEHPSEHSSWKQTVHCSKPITPLQNAPSQMSEQALKI